MAGPADFFNDPAPSPSPSPSPLGGGSMFTRAKLLLLKIIRRLSLIVLNQQNLPAKNMVHWSPLRSMAFMD